jgi:hypothetical protein
MLWEQLLEGKLSYVVCVSFQTIGFLKETPMDVNVYPRMRSFLALREKR